MKLETMSWDCRCGYSWRHKFSSGLTVKAPMCPICASNSRLCHYCNKTELYAAIYSAGRGGGKTYFMMRKLNNMIKNAKSTKIQTRLLCGCVLEERLVFYKSETRRKTKTLLRRVYDAEPDMSVNVKGKNFVMLHTSETCIDHGTNSNLGPANPNLRMTVDDTVRGLSYGRSIPNRTIGVPSSDPKIRAEQDKILAGIKAQGENAINSDVAGKTEALPYGTWSENFSYIKKILASCEFRSHEAMDLLTLLVQRIR